MDSSSGKPSKGPGRPAKSYNKGKRPGDYHPREVKVNEVVYWMMVAAWHGDGMHRKEPAEFDRKKWFDLWLRRNRPHHALHFPALSTAIKWSQIGIVSKHSQPLGIDDMARKIDAGGLDIVAIITKEHDSRNMEEKILDMATKAVHDIMAEDSTALKKLILEKPNWLPAVLSQIRRLKGDGLDIKALDENQALEVIGALLERHPNLVAAVAQVTATLLKEKK